MPGAIALPAQLHLPSAASVRSAAVDVGDFLTGHSTPAPKAPQQQAGSAAGKAHEVPAAVTRAVANAAGREPGKGHGQEPAYKPLRGTPERYTTGPAPGAGGYDPKTSTPDDAGTTATSVLYKNADGSYSRQVFAAPVNFKTAAGKWARVDTGLAKSTGGRWKAKAGPLSVSLAGRADDPSLASVSGKDAAGSAFGVSLGLSGASGVAGTPDGSTARYAGVLPDTDASVTDTETGVSADLILNSASAPSSWVFPLNLTGLSARAERDGSVDLLDPSGNVAAVIPEGLARDSAPGRAGAGPDNGATVQVPWTVVSLQGKPALAGSMPASWLDDPARVFPVTVDPQLNADTSGSTYVMHPFTNDYSGGAFLKVGYDGTSGEYARAFLQFSGLGSALQNLHVTAATLHVWDAWAWTCGTAEPFQADEITSSWSVTGNKSWPGPSIGTEMGSSDTTAPSSACTNTGGDATVGGWMKVPMSSAGLGVLNDWTLHPADDHGIAVSASTSNDLQWKQFDSFNTVHVPYLWINYSPDTAPQVNKQDPPDGYNSPTLTPQLIASGSDPDSWPNSLKYVFTVYNSSGSQVASSGLISAADWTVPSGKLSWGDTYYWTVQDYDGLDYSSAPAIHYLSVPVPQPLVTSGLSLNASGNGYDPANGNWTTSATDAKVPTVGPALEITRDYNSFDPRLDGAFGAGWSSVLDMEVAPGEEGASGATGTEVVTYPDGQQVAFGLNSDGSYSPPSGRYATLAAVSSGGFTLTDKNDTKYTFAQSLGSGAYGITSIADALGHTETFTWTSSSPYEVTKIMSASGRFLTVSWATPSGASSPHVSQVTTQDATAGDDATARTWGYSYSGDELASVCPPSSTSACTTYSYASGSDHPESVLDSGPGSYWRMDETSGTSAKSSVLANEGNDNATYSNVSLGSSAGPLAGSAATSASFDGSSSYVTLPSKLPRAGYEAVGLWFKTSTAGGVLFGYATNPLSSGSPLPHAVPGLYVGANGELYGEFYAGSESSAPHTSFQVDDGKWHYAVLSATSDSQSLYVDGVKAGSLSGQVNPLDMVSDTVGAGFWGSGWPEAGGGTIGYFDGDISDAAFWDRPLTDGEIKVLYEAGTHAAALATQVTRPSGKTFQKVSYDSLTGRVTSVTDPDGGTWGIGAPSVTGSSQVYRSAVLGAGAVDYWRLNDTGTTNPVNQLTGGTAVNNSVTEGVTGPFSDSTAYEFDGTSSYVTLPSGLVRAGNESMSLWFKTSTAGGVIFSSSASPITDSTVGGDYASELYIGEGGDLNAEFWNGKADPMLTSGPVDDGKWHNVILSANGDSERLYLDGKLQATLTGTVSLGSGQDHDYLGAGFLGGSWPHEPHSGDGGTGYRTYFKGDIAEVSFYYSEIWDLRDADLWNAAKYSAGLTPAENVSVTDPGGKTIKYAYDPLQGDRILSQTDALGNRTTYGYDISGFQAMTVHPDGDKAMTGYDVRGNAVTKTTCQGQAAGKCSTSYYTYYPDDTSSSPAADPRNDVLLTSRDPRSSSSGDTTYETSYAYNSAGEMTAETTPPVPGFSAGRTTTYAYTDGTTGTGGYNGAIPPKGLPYKVTTPGGAVTTTLYDADGDVAQVTDPDGLVTRYAYDGVGEVTSKIVISDSYPDGLTTSYAYDKDGLVTQETDPPVTDRVTGAVHTAQTSTTYDADGDVTGQTVTDTTGGDSARTVSRTWNSQDLLASETDAAGATTKYSYDAYGNKASETDANGDVTDYEYDPEANLTTTTLENYTGSPSGSQTPANLVQESRSYDPDGRLASVTDAMGRVMNYTYTDNGLPATITDASPDGTQTFTVESDTYDAAGNLTRKVTNNGATTTDYTADAAGRVTQQTLNPSGLDRTTSISYTPDDKQSTVTESGPGGTTQSTSYTYDPGGHMTSESLTESGAGGPVAWFPLTQTSGTAVTDSISGGPSATAADSVTWTGSAASFNGSIGQEVATTGPVVDTTGSFSVAAWVDLAGDTSDNQAVASQDAGTDSGFYLKYFPNSGGWQFSSPLTDTTDPSSWASANSASPASTGTWTFLTGTYDSGTGTMTLYVNGNASGNTATDASPIAAHGPFRIGAAKYDGTAANFFDGQIADVQVYPRALSASEVSALYGLGQGARDLTAGKLTTKWSLDQRGLPVSMTGPDGNVTDYSNDTAGQLAVTTQPSVTTETHGNSAVTAHPVTMTGYDTFGDQAEAENADGNVTTYGYDADGREVSKTLPPYTPPGSSSVVTAEDTTAYDALGEVTSSTDALGNTTKYDYDQLGDVTGVTAPDGSVTSYAYDADKEKLQSTSPTGAVTDSTYDFMGRDLSSTQVERQNSSGSSQAYTTDFTYGNGGWLDKSVTPDGAATQRAYDPAGEMTSVTDAAGDVTSYKYDDFGRQTALGYPDGTSKTTGYDAAGDVTSVQSLDASGNVLAQSSSTYDGSGHELSSTNADGNTTTFTYDATGMLTQEVQPVSLTSGITTSFGYDAAGNKTRYTDGNGNDWRYTYNPWGLQESEVEPATSQYSSAADSTFTTAYNADAQPVTETEPGGVTVTDSYNNVGELTGQSGAGADAPSADRSFKYDASGELTSASTSDTAPSSGTSNATSESFTYDDRGQVLTASGTAGSTSYNYNGDGLVTSVDDAAGTTSYGYDSADRLKTLSDPATGSTATYSYNNDSLVSGISYGSGGDTRTLSYDGLHRLTSDTLQSSSGSTVASVSYGYDAAGNLTSLDTTGLSGASSNKYTYDEAGRLASWNNGTATTDYGYDAAGNLTRDGSKTYTYDARDELTSDGSDSFSYTARGTMTSQTTSGTLMSSSFDAFGQEASAGTQAYTHDALGRMTAAADTSGSGASYEFSYAGSSGTIASDGVSTYTWDPSGSSLAGIGSVSASGGSAGDGVLAFTDVHGDVLGQFTAAGASVSGSTSYDPWGQVTATAGSVVGRLGFQSGWTDPVTSKVAMGARWYSPSAGNFTSADSVRVPPVPDPAMANPFAYVGDNPLTGTDPTGHCWSGFGWACSAAHKVASSFDRARHAVASAANWAWNDVLVPAWNWAYRHVIAPVVRAARNLAHKVADGAKSGVRAAGRVISSGYHYAVTKYHEAASYGTKVVRKAAAVVHRTVGFVKRTAGKAVKLSSKVVHYEVQGLKAEADWVGGKVKAAAEASGQFLSRHAAAIGGAVTGVAVFAGCMAVTGGVGSVGCAAAAGAAGNAVSYAIGAAQSGSFSWKSLGETTGAGALEGVAFDGLGRLASPLLRRAAAPLLDRAGPAVEQAGRWGRRVLAGCGGQSFTASTPVLLASGKAVPISSLKKGEKVKAVNTKTGKTEVKTIDAVLVHHDTDLYDLTVRAGGHTEVIHTTSSHLFWDPAERKWVKAQALRKGEALKTPAGKTAVADGGHIPAGHDGWMWDLTIHDDHDFYVLPAENGTDGQYYVNETGVTAVLVHNCDDAEMARMIHDAHPNQYIRERVITVGVMTTDGGRFAAQAGDEFTEEQLQVMAAHGIQPRPFIGKGIHAEPRLLDFADNGDLLQDGGLAKESIGASRDFCGPERADCVGLLRNAGATIVNSRLARW